jgi:hypothetical protein
LTKADAVLWQGTPAPLPAMLVWAAILLLALGFFALLYWYALATGRCVTWLLESDCTRPSRSKMEALFLGLAFMAAAAGGVVISIALGFHHERYTITAREIHATTGWPISGVRTQPLAHATIQREGNYLSFPGIGERPVKFGPLRPEDTEHILRLVKDLKIEATRSKRQE